MAEKQRHQIGMKTYTFENTKYLEVFFCTSLHGVFRCSSAMGNCTRNDTCHQNSNVIWLSSSVFRTKFQDIEGSKDATEKLQDTYGISWGLDFFLDSCYFKN